MAAGLPPGPGRRVLDTHCLLHKGRSDDVSVSAGAACAPSPLCAPLQAPHIPQGARPVVAASSGHGSPQGRAEVGDTGPEWCIQQPGAPGRQRGAVGHTPPPPGPSSSYETLVTSAPRSLLTAGLPLACLRGQRSDQGPRPLRRVAAADRRPHPPCHCSQPPPIPQYHPRLSCVSPWPQRDPWAAVRSRRPRGALCVPE